MEDEALTREQVEGRIADLEAALPDAGSAEEAVELEQQLGAARAQLAAFDVVESPLAGEVVDAEEAEDFRPSPAELVIADPRDAHEVFSVLDRHDEDLIVQELQRRVIKSMLYDFPQDGQRVVDLSVKGVQECIGLMNRTGKCSIRIAPTMLHLEETIEDGEPWVTATVYAEDARTGQGFFGTSSQPKRMKLKASTAAKRRSDGKPVGDDDTVWDKFARAKALNKAERNAYAKHIPETMRQTLIAQYKGDDSAIRVIQAGAGAQQLAELPPPLADDRAEQQKARARELYTAVREAAPLLVLPAVFNEYLTRAEHSHERLDDFLGWLEAKLEEATREKAA